MRGTTLLAGVAGFILISLSAGAAEFHTLYVFKTRGDAQSPQAALVRDSSGNLYGTTYSGGAKHFGTVFRLAPDGTETVLHSFTGDSDGATPAAGLILGDDGNLYGTTIGGGGAGCAKYGCGTVFRVTPGGSETVLYAFQGGKHDGRVVYWGVLRDAAGNIHGTATYGPGKGCFLNHGCGMVFELAPDGTKKILYVFKGGSDVGNPNSNLVRDEAGNLYGTARWGGGGANDGGIFRLAPDGTETVLYAATPETVNPAGLSADADGNLYTTVQGGRHGHGAVLKLAPDGTSSLVYSFRGKRDGNTSLSGVVVDAAQNLYGTTIAGGGDGCQELLGCGTVFKIAPNGTETVLHRFNDGKRGAYPFAGVIMDGSGHLYGTTSAGGRHGNGTVFEIDP